MSLFETGVLAATGGLFIYLLIAMLFPDRFT
jgi:K+-transporting ATPase KdpF subunit